MQNSQNKRFGKPQQIPVTMDPLEEQRFFFRVPVPLTAGEYRAKLEVLTKDFSKHALAGKPVFYSPFKVVGIAPSGRAIGGMNAALLLAPGEAAPPEFAPPTGLAFEEPDLLWENLNISATGVLLGDALKIRADLVNVGGDIAHDIKVAAEYANVRLPKRFQPISQTIVRVLAPGEKIELEFEYVFPDTALLGEYNVVLRADADDSVVELDEKNNLIQTPMPVRLSGIRQDFPDPGYVFDEAGLFLFRWDSRKYDEFKVQMGTEPNFERRENFFEIPQGDKWTPDREVVPLAGELPGMATGLMIKNKADTIYWRVLGRDSATGKLGNSLSLPFKIRLEERPKNEDGKADEGKATEGKQ